MKPTHLKKLRLTSRAFICILLTSCASPAPQAVPTTTHLPATPTPSASPTLKPTRTTIPTATGIPGFEDWSVFRPHAVSIAVENDALILTLRSRALWFMNERGVLVYKPTSGNFRITAEVHAARTSDPSLPPGGDGSVQLGGLMARSDNAGQENYVFIVIGNDGNGPSIETKNTVDSLSKYDGPGWDSVEAELRICRLGSTFNLYKRHLKVNEAWMLAESVDRPDLPDSLQVGVNIYTDHSPDITVRFENLRIDSITNKADCELD
jgi:hypothetical protein